MIMPRRLSTMKKNCFSRALGYLLICAFLALLGCASSNIQMPEPLPPIVREYKHATVYGGQVGMKNTGVYIEAGDTYSILATGSLDFGTGTPYRDVTPNLGWPFMMRIGDSHKFHPLAGNNGLTSTSYQSGYLHVGYKKGPVSRLGEPNNPAWYSSTRGAFNVDIIVWKKPDWLQIADFFAQMNAKSPGNKAIRDALADAEKFKSVYLSEEKAQKEIAETQKQIGALKKEVKPRKEPQAKPTPQEKQPAESLSKEDKIAQLQARLAKLLEIQNQLDTTKKELEQEREKASLLAEELGEKEKREQELLTQLAQGAKIPPVIMIASPKDGGTIEANSIGLSGVAEDEQGIEQLEIFINNRPLEDKTGRGLQVKKKTPSKRIEFNEPIPLQPGENKIKIRAVDADGVASEKTLVVKHVEMRKNIWAVVIGINDYPNAPRLKWAVADAQAFYRHLVDYIQIPHENVTLLLNQDAGLARLRSSLGTHLKKMAGKEDMVIIYFAGHGATEKDVLSPDGDGLEKYLLPYDVDLQDLYASALPMREISHIFYRIQSQRIIFIADSCYSGASGGRTISLSGIRANISDAFLDRIATGKGTVIMTASGANEVSAEDEKLKHGVFTFYLLEGLTGPADADKDGLVTVDEVYRYVSTHVPRATGQEQHPVKKGTVEGRLILSIIK
jgi:hypothetical protein